MFIGRIGAEHRNENLFMNTFISKQKNISWCRVLTVLLFLSVMYISKAQNIKEEPFNYSQELLDMAEKGDADAMYKIGLCYYVGKAGLPTLIKGDIPFEKNLEKAYQYLSQAAQKGSALAMVNLGNIYQSGVGAPKGKDLKQAIEWFEKAAEKGCADAYANIANIYDKEQTGLITQKIVKVKIKDAINVSYQLWDEAVRYNELAAEKGSAIGAYNLGIAYNMGLLNRVIDYQEATKWFRRATELGYMRSANDLAIRYISGIGIPQNKRMGLQLLNAAAKNEEPMALHNIGVYYYNGIMLQKDQEKGLLYFIRANQLGYNNSQALHECYLAGLHNAKNFATEKDWLNAIVVEQKGQTVPDVIIPEVQKEFLVEAGQVINDCGSWSIINDEGICVTERRYDAIVQDSETGKLTAGLYGYSTPLAADGSEEKPILEQILNSLEGCEVPAQVFERSLQILRCDHENALGYRAVAYYNIAVYWHNMNLTQAAENYLRKAIEIEPNFTAAKEDLVLLEEEAEKQQKELKKQHRATIWKCAFSIVGGLADMAGQVAYNNQQGKERKAADREAIRQKNKAKAREAKEQSFAAKKAVVGMIGHRATSNAYNEGIGILTDMKNSGMYDTPEFRQQQQFQKKLRENNGLQYHESEDW